MTTRMTKTQLYVLKALIGRIENRKSELRRVSITPEKVWAPYADNFTDTDEVDDFERDIRALSDDGLVNVTYADGRIKRIYAVDECSDAYYALTGVKRKCDVLRDELHLYEEFAGENSVIGRFCADQVERLQRGLKAKYPLERAVDLLHLLGEILGSDGEQLERELSVRVLGDTKLFERSYRSAVCSVLEEYDEGGDFPDEFVDGGRRERERMILERYGVVSNPSYVYVKGNLHLSGSDLEINVNADEPFAISAGLADKVNAAVSGAGCIMTIENLTSFHRVNAEGRLCIYTGGYPGRVVLRFLKKLRECNEGKEWLHFGDTDPDGFLILKALIRGTGIDFKPYMMDEELLMKYRESARALSERDMRICERLISEGEYTAVARCMLENGIKLEQEVCGRRVPLAYYICT